MLRRWIANLLPKKTRVEVVKVSSNTLSLDQWRGEKHLVSAANRVWMDGDFQLMIQCAENEHPAWSVLNPGANNEVRAARQAFIEGYTVCLANLRSMRLAKAKVELSEPTYGTEPSE